MKKTLLILTAVILPLNGCSGIHTFRFKNVKRYAPLPPKTTVYSDICRKNRRANDYYCQSGIEALGARKGEYAILGRIEIDRSKVAENASLVARREALKMGGNLIMYKESLQSYTGYYSTGVASYRRTYLVNEAGGNLVYYYVYRISSKIVIRKMRKMNMIVKVPRK